ncbi:hypothetical protein [Methanoregula sp.]|uniref:hypothetical protein n=1 Tax=Methanoregula sp. TaxID=2052170 RepID=UPI003564571F
MHQAIEIKGIERVNEFVDPELLKTTDVATFKNMILDKVGGKAIKRGGMAAFNSNSAGGGINSLHDTVNSGGTNILLASMGTKLIKSTSGTGAWSDLKTGLTTGLKTRIVPYLDKFIVSNGTDTIFMTDLSSTWNLEVTAPVITGISSSSTETDGNLRLGTYPFYRYLLVYVTNLGELSAPSQPFSHIFPGFVESTTKRIRFDGLPVSADSRVVARMLYRTKNISNTNTGGVYYLLATLDNATTYFIDSYADTVLDLSKTVTFVTVPTKAKTILAHKERIFFGNITRSTKIPIAPEFTNGNASPLAGYSGGADLTLAGAASVGGLLTTGTYKYRFALTDDSGRISDYIEVTVSVSGANNSVTISYPPTPPTSSYTMNIYRTKVGGSTYYKLTTLGFGEYSYTDIIADASLTVEMPTSSTETIKSGLMYSEIGQPAAVNAYNVKQINPDDGDEIMELIDMGDRIIIFKKNSIYQIVTYGDPLNWQIEAIYTKKGGDEEHLIKKAGDKIYFVSNNQLYRFPDFMEKPISLNKINSFKNITTFRDCFYSNYYNWFFVIADTTLFVYDEKLDSWYEFVSEDTGIKTWTCGIEKLYGTTRDTLIFGHSGINTVSKYDPSVFLDLAEEIISEITSKTFVDRNPTYSMRLRKLNSTYKKRDGQDVSHLIADPYSVTQKLIADSTNATYSSDYKQYRTPTDTMTGDLTLTNNFYYKISGKGLNEFDGAVIKFGIRNRGSRA